jgi:rubrerythrin
MAEMTMIEDARGNITWECSECKSVLKDKNGFEEKTKKCPKCGAEVTKFHSLFDEYGDLADI